MDDTYEKQVAVTIFEQLGGVGFATMIGLITPILVRVEAPGEITATFQWKAKSKDALNLMEVTYLEGSDTYRVVFGRITCSGIIRHQPTEDVYCDMLAPLFRAATLLDIVPPRFGNFSTDPDA